MSFCCPSSPDPPFTLQSRIDHLLDDPCEGYEAAHLWGCRDPRGQAGDAGSGMISTQRERDGMLLGRDAMCTSPGFPLMDGGPSLGLYKNVPTPNVYRRCPDLDLWRVFVSFCAVHVASNNTWRFGNRYPHALGSRNGNLDLPSQKRHEDDVKRLSWMQYIQYAPSTSS